MGSGWYAGKYSSWAVAWAGYEVVNTEYAFYEQS